MPRKPELRQEWIAAGYGPTMGSAEVVSPPPTGILRVYHFTSAKFAKDDIRHGRMKVARISDLNDPFELLAMNFQGIPDRKIITDFKADFDNHTGLLCFSRNWTSPVLWSHYADKHRGVCLGFDVKEEFVQQVRYIEKRAMINAENPTLVYEKLKNFVLHTKHNHWDYEEECRRFVSLADTDKEGGMRFYPFDDTLSLAEVILGPNCDTSLDEMRVITRARYDTVKIYKARLASQWFAVVPEQS